MPEFSLTLPAWYLVAQASVQLDGTGTPTLSDPPSFVTIDGAAGPAVPLFSSEALANQFIQDHRIPAVAFRINTAPELLEFFAYRVPPETVLFTFDPKPGFPGHHVTREEAVRVTRGAVPPSSPADPG